MPVAGEAPYTVVGLVCACAAVATLTERYRGIRFVATLALAIFTARLGYWLGATRASRANQQAEADNDARLRALLNRLAHLEAANSRLEAQQALRSDTTAVPLSQHVPSGEWWQPTQGPRPGGPPSFRSPPRSQSQTPPQYVPRTAPNAAQSAPVPSQRPTPPPPAADAPPESGNGDTHTATPPPARAAASEDRGAEAMARLRASVAAAAADAAAVHLAREVVQARLIACGAVAAAHTGDVGALLAALGSAPPTLQVDVRDPMSCRKALRSATARWHPDRVMAGDVEARATALEVCQLLQACRAVLEEKHTHANTAQQAAQQAAQQEAPAHHDTETQQSGTSQEAAAPSQPPMASSTPPRQQRSPRGTAHDASDEYYEAAKRAAEAAEAHLRSILAQHEAAARHAAAAATAATDVQGFRAMRPVRRAKRPPAVPANTVPGAAVGDAHAGVAPPRRLVTPRRPMHVD